MPNNLWIPEHVKLYVDDYAMMPTGNIISIDLETNAQEIDNAGFKLVCIGISDGSNCYIYFDIRPELIDYLRKTKWIGQDIIHAELPWLNKLYGGFTPEHIYYDTKVAGYVNDSTKKNYGLKAMVSEYLGVTYPTYAEICERPEYIAEACDRFPDRKKETKKGFVLPKRATLDIISRDVVANYNAADCFYTYKLFEYFKKHETTAKKAFRENIEDPTNKLIARMEAKGIKIDTKEIRRIHNETSKERRKYKKILKQEATRLISPLVPIKREKETDEYKKKRIRFERIRDEFNPNSPKQVLPILHASGIPTKVASTDEDTITKYSHLPFVSSLLEYRGLQKVCSTYTIPLYFNTIKSSDSRIRARFGQNTITGRLSSSDPVNLENQPPAVRSAFVAEDRCSLLDADWKALEIYLPAHYSGEPNWINILRDPNGDIHDFTTSRLFGESVRSLPEKDFKKQRAIAKETLLTIANSGTFKSLAVTLNCSEKEAKEFEEATKLIYPTYMKWLTETKKRARQQLGISTYFGRWVNFPQLNLWCGRSDCPIFGEGGYFCKPCFIRAETEKQAISVKVQGTGGDLIKMTALRLYKEYGYVPVNIIHDEYLGEFLDTEIEQATERVRYVMQNLWSFTVSLKAEIKIAKTWRDAH